MAKPKLYKIKALVNITYDRVQYVEGKEIKVRKEDAKELVLRGFAKAIDNLDSDTDKNSEGPMDREGE